MYFFYQLKNRIVLYMNGIKKSAKIKQLSNSLIYIFSMNYINITQNSLIKKNNHKICLYVNSLHTTIEQFHQCIAHTLITNIFTLIHIYAHTQVVNFVTILLLSLLLLFFLFAIFIHY